METKTIILSEKERKRYELDVANDEGYIKELCHHNLRINYKTLFSGSVSDFLLLPNKEEIAENVVRSSEWHFPFKHNRYVDYNFPFDKENKQKWREGFGSSLESVLSAIGEYKYIIITESEI